MWLYVVRPNIIGVPRSPTLGWCTLAPTTVAIRPPARSARSRYSWSSPQMKNSSRGRPIRSTSSRVTSTPLNGMTTSRIRPSTAAAATSSIRCTTLVPPGSRIGKTRRSGSASSTTTGPQKSSSSLRASSVPRQSGSGIPSSSISQARSAPRSIAHSRPSWNPPAPPRFSARVRCVTPAPVSHSPLPSLDALSTTRISSTSGTSRSRATRRCSSGRRLNVTTTATTRTPDTLR